MGHLKLSRQRLDTFPQDATPFLDPPDFRQYGPPASRNGWGKVSPGLFTVACDTKIKGCGEETVTGPDDNDAAMRARLKALSQDLAKGAKPGPERTATSDKASSSALSLGLRVTSEFVAAIVVGTFIGWQLDRWLHTSPGMLILFIALGTAAGFYNVYRIATKTGGT